MLAILCMLFCHHYLMDVNICLRMCTHYSHNPEGQERRYPFSYLMSAIFDDETAVEQVQHKGGIKEKTEKTTMQLLREVFGKGPIYCWLLPCRTTTYPLLTPPGYDV
ncbi:uncharacterized protein [Apostichopus japonicus]|uniref:uncharacterized protein n=1 Tax=Stichopus japonicus TaxID=307972 RepID=UPI003AB3BFC1